MKRDSLRGLGPIQVAGVGILVSATSSLAVYLITRKFGAGNPVPEQPATDRPITETAPLHFTEEIVVPGITETGEQIEQHDDTLGRSRGGV